MRFRLLLLPLIFVSGFARLIMPAPGLLFPQARMASTAGMLQDHWSIAAWGIVALARRGTAAVFTLREPGVAPYALIATQSGT